LAAVRALKLEGFSYAHHGQDWILGECGSRERQSPVDFGVAAPWDCNTTAFPTPLCHKGRFFFDYELIEQGFILRNDGHTLTAELKGQGYGGVTYNGRWFDIVAVNFHVKSEHTFHGRQLPLELQLVHRQWDSEHVLIVAVPFDTVPPPVTLPPFAFSAPFPGPAPAPAPAPAPGPAPGPVPGPAPGPAPVLASTDSRVAPTEAAPALVPSAGAASVTVSKLKVTCQRARGLKDEDWFINGYSDPFCTCEIVGRPDSIMGTQEEEETADPEWDANFEFDYKSGDALKFTVSDKDWGSTTLLGEATLPSEDFIPDGFEGEVPLIKDGKGDNGYLSVKITPVVQGSASASFLHVVGLLEQEAHGHGAGAYGRARQWAPAPVPAPAPSESLFSAELAAFMSDPLPASGTGVQVPLLSPLDLLSPLVGGGVFFEYQGSFTAPPCTEQVTWLVRRNPLVASQAQTDLLQSTIYQDTADSGNWRSTMPLMGRPVFVRSAAKGVPALEEDLPLVPNSPRQPIPAKLHAQAVAEEAMGWAMEAERLAGEISVATTQARQQAVSAARGLP